VADITPREIIEMLQPIWHVKRETASRVLQRASATFKSAIVRGYRTAGNPTEGVREELGKARPKVQHRPALPWQEAPAFMDWLRSRSQARPATRLCLELLVLTALRSEEIRLAKWGEFDPAAGEWTLPGIDPVESKRSGYSKKRMKLGRDHIVPLSTGALAVLDQAKALRQDASKSALVFPSHTNTPLSDNTLSKLMRDAGFNGTPHGFRSTFKDWCAEGGVRDEVSEAALAHGDPDKVRAAYRRATYFEERREIMQKWSDFLLAKPRCDD
jgi:integrase